MSTRPNTNSHPSQPAPHWSTRTPVPRPTPTLTNTRGFPGWSLPLAPVLVSAGVDVKLGLGLRAILQNCLTVCMAEVFLNIPQSAVKGYSDKIHSPNAKDWNYVVSLFKSENSQSGSQNITL